VATVDILLTLLLMVGSNVISQLIIDWLKDIRKNDDEHDKNDER